MRQKSRQHDLEYKVTTKDHVTRLFSFGFVWMQQQKFLRIIDSQAFWAWQEKRISVNIKWSARHMSGWGVHIVAVKIALCPKSFRVCGSADALLANPAQQRPPCSLGRNRSSQCNQLSYQWVCIIILSQGCDGTKGVCLETLLSVTTLTCRAVLHLRRISNGNSEL